MAEVVHTVELLQEASQWFPGGSKEMRVSEGRCRPLALSAYIWFPDSPCFLEMRLCIPSVRLISSAVIIQIHNTVYSTNLAAQVNVSFRRTYYHFTSPWSER